MIGGEEFKLYCVKLNIYINRLIEVFLATHHIKTVHKSGEVFSA